MTEIPVARTLTLCEQTIVDRRSENVSAINCFMSMGVDRFPSLPQRFSVYAVLTNGNGSCNMVLEVMQLETQEIIYSTELNFYFPDPLTAVRFTFRTHNCVFPAAGKYNVRLLSSDHDVIADAVVQVYHKEFET